MKTSPRRSLALALVLLCGLGCKSYEGQVVDFELKSTPAEATVYLIPWEKWAAEKGEERVEAYRAARESGSPDAAQQLQALEAAFSPYRRDEGVTPVTVKVKNYGHQYLAVHGSAVGRVECKPKQGGSKELILR